MLPLQKSGRDPILQGLILWDLRLFFEMHEVLERAWRHSAGGLRLMLQTLIRAAGVYIKLEYGYHRQAARLAEKACAALKSNSSALGDYFAPEELISTLRALNPTPPILLAESPPSHPAGRQESSGRGDAGHSAGMHSSALKASLNNPVEGPPAGRPLMNTRINSSSFLLSPRAALSISQIFRIILNR